MAHNHHASSTVSNDDGVPPSMDYAAHEGTYEGFIRLVKWSIIGLVILVLFLFIVIHPMVPTPT